MRCYDHSGPAPAFAEGRTRSWRGSFDRIPELVGAWRERSRQRRELLDFMAGDHRAASDIGRRYEARKWADRPFWRP